MTDKNEIAQARTARLDTTASASIERIAKLRAALKEVSEVRFGNDGDCGTTRIAEDALYADEQAAAQPVQAGEAVDDGLEFAIKDADLNALLNAAADWKTAPQNMDTGIYLADLIEKVESRLAPVAAPSPVGQVREDIERISVIWFGNRPPHGTNLYATPVAAQQAAAKAEIPSGAGGQDAFEAWARGESPPYDLHVRPANQRRGLFNIYSNQRTQHAYEGFLGAHRLAAAKAQDASQSVNPAAQAVKDGCKLCLGAKGGVPGNENVIGGVVVCDYCTSTLMDMKTAGWFGAASPASTPDASQQAAAEKPVARLQAEVSDRPFSEGKTFFEVVILDRARAADGMELYAAPATAGAATTSEDAQRYLWLRNKANSAVGKAPMVFNCAADEHLGWDQSLWGQSLDDAIDIAMRATSQEVKPQQEGGNE